MKKLFIFIVFVFVFTNSNSQEIGFGLTIQGPSSGLSGKVVFDNTHAGEIIFGVLGTVNNLSGKYSYYINRENKLDKYIYLQAGNWKYNSIGMDESVFGYAIGVGIDFSLTSFYWWPKNLKTSIELGLNKVNLNYYDYPSINFGVGLHYYLD